MSNLKRVVLILLLFSAILIAISMFLPSSFQMERSIVVDADKELIFKQVNDLKNWKNWSPWALKDESIYKVEEAYSNPSNGVGAFFEWDSDNDDVGTGRLEIVSSEPNSFIQNSINFGFTVSLSDWNFNEIENGVKVSWGINIDFGFSPLSKFFGLFMEDQMAPDFELGLERLKTFAENLPKIKRVEVTKEFIEKDLWFLSIRDTVDKMEMNNVHGKIYAKINKYMDEEEVVINKTPLVIYHFWLDTLIDIELGIPVQDSTLLGNEEIKMNKINSGNVVTAVHYGPYDRLPETYFGINEWMRKNQVVVTGPPWESYITDPAKEPNPEKWETAIFFPIE